MAYVYAQVDDLQNSNKVGNKQCVALVRHYANLPATSQWQEGASVWGNSTIAKGTAIATFVNGRYQSLPNGNHAAFFISQDGGGIWVMDQWASDASKPKVSKRYIRRKGKLPSGAFIDPSNNADDYAIID